MKQYALITDKHEIWREDFHVTSKETAKEEILEVIKYFNDNRIDGEFKRYLHSMPIKNKKVVYFADPMGGDLEEEAEFTIVRPLMKKGILFDKIRCFDTPPFRKLYDILFFDWGGMSFGNSLMESFCEEIIEQAKDYPNRMYVMVSMMTKEAMKDALRTFGKEAALHNIFLDLDAFAKYYKKFTK